MLKYLKTFYWLVVKLFYIFSKTFDLFLMFIVIRCNLLHMKITASITKSSIKIVALAIYTNLFFLLHTLSLSAAK